MANFLKKYDRNSMIFEHFKNPVYLTTPAVFPGVFRHRMDRRLPTAGMIAVIRHVASFG